MKLAPQQDQAAKAVDAWRKDPGGKQFFYLAGYAGTGKTTIAKWLAESVGDVCFATFTGKAALVLQSKGCDGASTIHSLIYKIDNPNSPVPRFVINPESPAADADLIVIDEVSMVGEELGRDLMSFGRKILVLGDPEQLPPIEGPGYFTSGEPDFMLTEIHRQAADNPIIRLSMMVREDGRLDRGTYGESVVRTREGMTAQTVLDADQVLVGKNQTRRKYNGRLRSLLGFTEPHFMLNDRVICLKNDKEKGLLNGSIWRTDKIRKQTDDETVMEVSPLDAGMVKVPQLVSTHHAWLKGEENNLDWREKKKYQPFDFAYAITVHKAQGSQWNNVCVFDESYIAREDARRWLYTAVTRAAEKVTVIL
jgi:exodeoxyribonuclease-5